MPRSSSKPQAEKREQKSPEKVVTEPKVAEEEETVPSGETEIPLTDELGQEEADEAVEQVKEEPKDIMKGCFKAPDVKQLSASLALWAKNYLTEMVEGHILCLDRGEEPEEACKTEDSEAEPTASDPWLQGCMPVVNVAPQQMTSNQQVVDIIQAEAQKPAKSISKQQRNAVTQLACSSPPLHKKGTSLSSPPRSLQGKAPCVCPPLKLKKQKMVISPRPQPCQLLPPISTAPEREEVEVKSENRPLLAPSSTTGPLLRLRNQRPIPKLDPSHLPQHCVFPQHMVLDSITPISQKSSRKPSQLSKLVPVFKSQTEMATSSSDYSGMFLKRDEAAGRLDHLSSSTYGHSRERTPSLGPLTLDKMKLAEGVSLLDPPADEKNYLQSKLLGLATKLNPIQSGTAVPLYSVEQVIAGPPQVTQLFQPKK